MSIFKYTHISNVFFTISLVASREELYIMGPVMVVIEPRDRVFGPGPRVLGWVGGPPKGLR